ncbi:MAG: hypothetical protein BWZ10_03262 [candidate division BRC1 bacterium ADurb.BinA364]|nr:MAG: hypothetical protein BWZ10_03262 [candidate division BRC1 bacterium ADurb.BinA364]
MSLADFPAIRFWPDGRSNSAVLRLIRTVDDPAIETNYTTIKLFGPTGVARTYYSERR